jgi:hypothetical protein
MYDNDTHTLSIVLECGLIVKLNDFGRRRLVTAIPHTCAVCRIIIVYILL